MKFRDKHSNFWSFNSSNLKTGRNIKNRGELGLYYRRWSSILNELNYTTSKVRIRIYLQDFDLDVWLYVDIGLIHNEVDEQTKEEILRGFSKLDLEKVICCETTKGIEICCSPFMIHSYKLHLVLRAFL